MEVGIKSQDLSFVSDNDLNNVTAANGVVVAVVGGYLLGKIIDKSLETYVEFCKFAVKNPHGIPQSYRR